MKREILDILLAVENGKLSAVDAHKKIVSIQKQRDSDLVVKFSEKLTIIKNCPSDASARRVFKAILKNY